MLWGGVQCRCCAACERCKRRGVVAVVYARGVGVLVYVSGVRAAVGGEGAVVY